MQICIQILEQIKVIVVTVIAVVEWIVETVCDWVTTILHFAKEVCEKVCGWLGPFSFLCDWVCKVIEWTETVTEWVCEEVLVKVLIGFLYIVTEYVFYILTWVCWVIDWIPRGIAWILCKLGLRGRRFIHVCVKVLEESLRSRSWDPDEVQRLLDETATRLQQCSITLCVVHSEVLVTDDHRSGITCGFGGLFTGDHHWFRRHECPPLSSIIPITIYFVEDVSGAKGCSIPGTNYVLADKTASNATIAHEIGHLSDLWGHSSNPTNVMFSPSSDDSVNFTGGQCCMLRTSKYASTMSPVCK